MTKPGNSTRTSALRLYGGTCHYCPEPATTIDHIVPRSVGGPTKLWNLAPACRPCNGFKASLRAVCPCYRCIAAELRFVGVPRPTLPRRSHRPVLVGYVRCPRCEEWRKDDWRQSCPCARAA